MVTSRRFSANTLTLPGTRHALVVPDDDNDLPWQPRTIYCAATGDVVMRDEFGTDLTYPMVAGQFLVFRPARILATNTTATVFMWD